jgi:hypothetical protein
MWNKWRPVFGWQNLCPISLSDPFGFFVIMPRAKQPVTFEAVVQATPYYYPDITSETKPEDFGIVGSKVVALDYGLADHDMVLKRRAYYENHALRKV